jgi:c-di-GMP-binding flagellar brake protein YcgR
MMLAISGSRAYPVHPVSDRRTKARFEIVGRLPGTLATERRVQILNLSAFGALIETPTPLQPETEFNIVLESDRHLATLRARVRHVRPTHLDDGYLVGLEFLEAGPGDVERLLGTVTTDGPGA